MSSSAQELYLNSGSPAVAPGISASEVITADWKGTWAERNRAYQEAVNEYNAQKLLTQAEWERDDSQYQRMVADLKKAGINPYYALNQGGISLGSSTGQELYKTNGKSSKIDSSSKGLGGLIALAALLVRLLV